MLSPHRKSIILIGLGSLLLLVYGAAAMYSPFRPNGIQGFLEIFGVAFAVYGLATWNVLADQSPPNRSALVIIFGFAVAFNGLLLPTLPTLSDDMYRYVWDGRVQANGINPYRFASDAPALTSLRDNDIWGRMNRPSAITVYPPAAELTFAIVWRLFPDSITGIKLVMVAATLLAGALLMRVLVRLGQNPMRALIFLWSPLLIFEVAHSAHVDALYLPLILGALLLRLSSPSDRISLRHEIAIGALIGLATLTKLYPLILLPALWSVRRASWRDWLLSFCLPLATMITIGLGYALYIAPGVDTLGFLPSYSREFFNIAPIPLGLIYLAQAHNIAFYLPSSVLFPLLIVLVSLFFVIRPAASGRTAVLRAAWPIMIYLLVTINLFSWYVLWLLPFIAMTLSRFDFSAIGWWLFSGLVVLSYTLFITGYAQDWAAWVEFIPVYSLLGLALFATAFSFVRSKRLRSVQEVTAI